MEGRRLFISLSEAEAAALSCAAVWADGKHQHPNLQAARLKLRAALDKPGEHEAPVQRVTEDPGQRYIHLEC